MTGFTGRWTLVSAENSEAFMTATHTPAAVKTKMMGIVTSLKTNPEAIVEEMNVNKARGTFHMKLFVNGEVKHDLTLEMNKEIDFTGMDEIPAKMMLTMMNDSKMMIHRKTTAAETDIVYNLGTSGTEMTLTMTCGGVTCTNKFKKH
jgi:hypothetical protein